MFLKCQASRPIHDHVYAAKLHAKTTSMNERSEKTLMHQIQGLYSISQSNKKHMLKFDMQR